MSYSGETAARQRAAHIPHVLHTGQRLWSRSNSQVSLWVELLHGWGFEPVAAFACAVALDFDGDQFTVLTLPPEDLKVLFGVTTSRLAIYDRLENHVATQTRAGNVVLAEVDAFHLPDAPSLYGVVHGPTLIGIERLDPAIGSASYYRQGQRFDLRGNDYVGIFRQPALAEGYHDTLIRHVESVKRVFPPISNDALAAISVRLLRRHLARVPLHSPIAAFRKAFENTLETLASSDETFRHAFAYGTLSQLGSQFELFSAYLAWLGTQHQSQPAECLHASRRIVSEALICKMRVLRASMRGQTDRCEDSLDVIEASYQALVAHLRTS